MNLNSFTVMQLLIACGMSRGLSRREICKKADASPAYIVKCMKDDKFLKLVTYFKAMPYDKDTVEYKGLSTLYMDIGRLFYQNGEKITNE